MNNGSKIFVAGANGMVGSAIIRELKKNGFNNLLTPSSKELDLRNQVEVSNFFETNKGKVRFVSIGVFLKERLMEN